MFVGPLRHWGPRHRQGDPGRGRRRAAADRAGHRSDDDDVCDVVRRNSICCEPLARDKGLDQPHALPLALPPRQHLARHQDGAGGGFEAVRGSEAIRARPPRRMERRLPLLVGSEPRKGRDPAGRLDGRRESVPRLGFCVRRKVKSARLAAPIHLRSWVALRQADAALRRRRRAPAQAAKGRSRNLRGARRVPAPPLTPCTTRGRRGQRHGGGDGAAREGVAYPATTTSNLPRRGVARVEHRPGRSFATRANPHRPRS
ncbi:hypothetical protein M885DRAFT_165523 [Pelagophyceae sp. CCMP2097]|nr:hypothetical protein M885DRAFT_165523 [Pelagophyceae sp. CCMP2097]